MPEVRGERPACDFPEPDGSRCCECAACHTYNREMHDAYAKIGRLLDDKLREMTLVDATGDPHDEGYMAAIAEIREWMAKGGRAR